MVVYFAVTGIKTYLLVGFAYTFAVNCSSCCFGTRGMHSNMRHDASHDVPLGSSGPLLSALILYSLSQNVSPYADMKRPAALCKKPAARRRCVAGGRRPTWANEALATWFFSMA